MDTEQKEIVDMKQPAFVPTLENVRAYFAQQHIPDIVAVGPEATPGGYRFVVERGAPEWCKRELNQMYPASVGTEYNNLMLAPDSGSMSLRYTW